jgi:hypothetical protein
MNDLDYEYHRAHYAQIFAPQTPEDDEYVRSRALETHILCVHDALRDEQYKSVTIANTLRNLQARHFALYGAGRRFGMLWAAYRSILSIVTVGRKEPLSGDDVRTVSRDLNTIYINIVGTIDNYAWCLRHECGSPAVQALQDTRIGLFGKAFIEDTCFSKLRPQVVRFQTWFEDLRTRRDPAAHRIPLSVPPAVLQSDDAKRYQAIEDEISTALRSLDFASVDRLHTEQQQLGRFLAAFLHHPDEALTPFYPTVPQDLGYLVRISDSVREFLRASNNETPAL